MASVTNWITVGVLFAIGLGTAPLTFPFPPLASSTLGSSSFAAYKLLKDDPKTNQAVTAANKDAARLAEAHKKNLAQPPPQRKPAAAVTARVAGTPSTGISGKNLAAAAAIGVGGAAVGAVAVEAVEEHKTDEEESRREAAGDSQVEESHVEASRVEENHVEESKVEENRVEESQAEESNAANAGESQTEEIRTEENRVEENYTETHTEEKRMEETYADQEADPELEHMSLD